MLYSHNICGTLAQVLAQRPHSKKVQGSIPAWGAVGANAQVGYLCGVCMFSPYSQGVSSTKNPNRKTCKTTEHMSIPDQRWTVHFTWSPGATSCPLLLGGP